jgi:hypothetical protein
MIACTSDIVIADMVHDAMASYPRGERMYVSELWSRLPAGAAACLPVRTGSPYGTRTIADLKAWLVSVQGMTDASSRPLVVLSSDVIQADPAAVAASSTIGTDGGGHHFVVRRDHASYAPARKPVVVVGLDQARERNRLARGSKERR